LKVANTMYEMISDPKERKEIKQAVDKLEGEWKKLLVIQKKNNQIIDDSLKQEVLQSEVFQQKNWQPFQTMIQEKHANLGNEWQSFFLEKVQNLLLNTNL
jgi:hypothetical protein